jgi:DNA polymerase I
LFVCFVGAAEMSVYHNLGWKMPEHVLDLFAEFRCHTNMGSKEDQAERTPFGRGLLGASLFFGLPVINSDEKTAIQKAVGSDTWRGVYTPEQILDYCQSDVEATRRLLLALVPKITNLPCALLRGRYTKAAAVMEQTGIPLDVEMLGLFHSNREKMAISLTERDEIATFGVYENGEFRIKKFEAWLVRNDIPWRRLKSGKLDLDDDTFELMAETYPAVEPLFRVRQALSDLRSNKLVAGHDGRNRAPLWAFGARTGRNTPKSGQFIFGPSVWLRGLIKPPEDANLDGSVRLRARRHRQKGIGARCCALHFSTDFVRPFLRENPHFAGVFARRSQPCPHHID